MDRVVEIVNYLIRQYLTKHNNELDSDQTLVSELVRLGYTQQEVEKAFNLMCQIPNYCDSKTRGPNYSDNARPGHRVLSPVEKKKLSLACQGEIFRLIYSSLLTPEELEQVIIEALQSETNEVGIKELESILHKVINDEERLLMIIQYPLENGPCFLLN